MFRRPPVRAAERVPAVEARARVAEGWVRVVEAPARAAEARAQVAEARVRVELGLLEEKGDPGQEARLVLISPQMLATAVPAGIRASAATASMEVVSRSCSDRCRAQVFRLGKRRFEWASLRFH